GRRSGRCAELGSGAAFGGAADLHMSAIPHRLAGPRGVNAAAGKSGARGAMAAAFSAGVERRHGLLVRRLLLDSICAGLPCRPGACGGVGAVLVWRWDFVRLQEAGCRASVGRAAAFAAGPPVAAAAAVPDISAAHAAGAEGTRHSAAGATKSLRDRAVDHGERGPDAARA